MQPARRAMLAIAAVFLLTPSALVAAGVRPGQFENRAAAAPPSVHQGFQAFPQASLWADDRLPLREQAVRLVQWVDRVVFGGTGTSPSQGPSLPIGPGAVPAAPREPWTYPGYPEVVRGSDGTLFYGGDFAQLCNPTRSAGEISSALAQLIASIEQSGRRVVVVSPPDKSAVLADRLPASPTGEACRQERIDQLQPQLDAMPEVLPLLPHLRALELLSDEPLYLDKDTHWDGPAAAVMATSLIDALNPAAAGSLVVRSGAAQTGTGDLSIFIGRPAPVTYHPTSVAASTVRRSWRDVPTIDETPRRYVSTGPTDTQIAGRSLLIGDSFALAARATVPEVFTDLTELHVETAALDPALVAEQMGAADTVVIEVVQRELYSGDSPILDPAFIALAGSYLAANPR